MARYRKLLTDLSSRGVKKRLNVKSFLQLKKVNNISEKSVKNDFPFNFDELIRENNKETALPPTLEDSSNISNKCDLNGFDKIKNLIKVNKEPEVIDYIKSALHKITCDYNFPRTGMYYVVKNYKNEFYVVVKTWLQTIKGNVFAFYPPTEAQTNKALACLSTPGLDWTNEEVKIVSNQFLKYADAVSEMNKKLKFYDSAAEEEFEKKKSHARLHPVGNKSRGRSFNLAFEDESPAVKVQKISSVDANDYITDEVPESKVQEKINDLFPQEETNKISIEKPNTETLLSQLVTVDNITDVRSNESHVMIPKSIWDEMLSQIKEINIKINENASKTDENFISIVNELKDLRIGLNINKNNIQMSFEKPKKISTQLELNEKEKSLDDFNQRDSYLKLVSDMARCLQKPSKSYSSEHGLVKSFMELYFDSEFLKEMGWTNVKGRLSFETYRMHHKLIFEACNIHTPNLFPNVDAATKSIINFFKRLHETKKSKNNFDSDPLLKEK